MYDSQMVDCKQILPFAKELILRCGSVEKAARYSEIGVSTYYKVTSYGQCYVLKPTAKKLILALDRKRREDRQNGHVSVEFRKHLISVAKVESKMETKARKDEISEPPPSHFYEE
jgi:hypothetical protein